MKAAKGKINYLLKKPSSIKVNLKIFSSCASWPESELFVACLPPFLGILLSYSWYLLWLKLDQFLSQTKARTQTAQHVACDHGQRWMPHNSTRIRAATLSYFSKCAVTWCSGTSKARADGCAVTPHTFHLYLPKLCQVSLEVHITTKMHLPRPSSPTKDPQPQFTLYSGK